MKILKEQGYLVESRAALLMHVGTHDRCGTTVEPLIKQQWFVKMEELAKPAIEALKTRRTEICAGAFRQDLSYTGWRISKTGVFPDRSGGDTESRHTTVTNAEILSWHRDAAGEHARTAAARTLHRMRIRWIHGFQFCAVAVLHTRLAGQDGRSGLLLSDGRACDRIRHHLLLGDPYGILRI